MSSPTSAEPLAALTLARRLVDEFGVPHGNQRVAIHHSSRQIANALGRSSGTVAAQLRQLDELGIRIASRPVTVIDIARLDHALGSGSMAAAVPSASITDVLFARVLEIVERNPDTAQAMAVLATAIAQTHQPATATSPSVSRPSVTDPVRDGDAGLRDVSRARAVPSRKVRKSVLPKPSRVVSRTADEAAQLVAPLEQAAQRLGLAGMNRVDGLTDALAAYDDASVECAVGKLVRELAAGGSVIRNPISLLISRARSNPEFFMAPATAKARPLSVSIDDLTAEARSVFDATESTSEVSVWLARRGCDEASIEAVLARLTDSLAAA